MVASAAKACPLRAVGIPVDPPCAAIELAEIIQATHRNRELIEKCQNIFQFSVQMCSEATGKRLESLSIPSRQVQLVSEGFYLCMLISFSSRAASVDSTRVQPLVGPDLGALLAEHCPNLSTLCINSEKVLRLCHAKRYIVIGAYFY